MVENQLLNIIRSISEKHPDLISFFERICKKYKSNRKLQNTIKFNTGERPGISEIFADTYIKTNTLYLRKAVMDSDFDENKFIYALFALTGINPDEESSNVRIETLLLKLKTYFSSLSYVHEYLSSNTRILKKYSYDQLENACKITINLLDNNVIHDFSTLGVSCLADSKSIRKGTSLYNLVGDFINSELNMGYSINMSRNKAFETVGISDNPTAIKVSLFAPLIYKNKNGIIFDWVRKLWECGESAVLSLDNIQNISECWLDIDCVKLVTCENESPFNFMIRHERTPVIYTAGYPNTAVKLLLKQLCKSVDMIFHWGDTDLHGLKIADIVNSIGKVMLWRCTITDIRNNLHRLKKLNSDEKNQIQVFLEKYPDFEFQTELEYTLKYGWLEQEAFLLTLVN